MVDMSSNSASSKAGTAGVWLSAILLIAGLIITFVMTGKVTGSCDRTQEVDKALSTIAYVNGAAILLMTLLALTYVRSFPDMRDNYIFLMTHLALFLSLMGVSIAVIAKRGC